MHRANWSQVIVASPYPQRVMLDDSCRRSSVPSSSSNVSLLVSLKGGSPGKTGPPKALPHSRMLRRVSRHPLRTARLKVPGHLEKDSSLGGSVPRTVLSIGLSPRGRKTVTCDMQSMFSPVGLYRQVQQDQDIYALG